MKETKNARFRRVAEARVNKIIRMLRLLGNCSGTNTYAYDADAVEQIFTALQIELRCGGHTVLWAISAGKGNEVWKR